MFFQLDNAIVGADTDLPKFTLRRLGLQSPHSALTLSENPVTANLVPACCMNHQSHRQAHGPPCTDKAWKAVRWEECLVLEERGGQSVTWESTEIVRLEWRPRESGRSLEALGAGQ